MLRTFRKKTATLVDHITRILPDSCALCHRTGQSGLCDVCLNRYFTGNPPRCRQCALLLPESRTPDRFCGTCLRQPPSFDRIIAAADYAPPIDQLVLSLKFGSSLALAPLFTRLLAAAIRKHLPQNHTLPSLLVPVPLADRRLASRGFNQALEIARPLSRHLDIPLVPHLAERIRETASQMTISLKERKKNICGAFAINPAFLRQIQGQHIGLIDDVLTTGETMGELARILKQAGASRISGFVFARTSL